MEKTALRLFIDYLEGIKERDSIPTWAITTGKNFLELEKNQMRKMYNQGGKWASEICSEDFFDSEYTQRSE